eukprot:1528687-Rhodomonas_salina.2
MCAGCDINGPDVPAVFHEAPQRALLPPSLPVPAPLLAVPNPTYDAPPSRTEPYHTNVVLLSPSLPVPVPAPLLVHLSRLVLILLRLTTFVPNTGTPSTHPHTLIRI